VIVVVRGGRTALEQIHEGAQLPQQVEQGLGLVHQLVGQSLNAVEKLAQSGVGFVAEGGGFRAGPPTLIDLSNTGC
jgi:hypothetical protein